MMATANLNVRDYTQRLTMTVNLRGFREFRMRVWLASKIMVLAA